MQHSVIPHAVTTYSANPAERDIDAIIANNTGLVSRIAWHVHSRMSSSIEIADLIQVGMIALLEGARNFEERGVDFKAYASTRVRGAMIDELRREAKISRTGMQNKKRLMQAKRHLSGTLCRDPLPDEIANEMNVTIEEYYQIEASANALKQESIDEAYADHDMWFADLTNNPFDELDRSMTAEKLSTLIASLPERQATILQLYFVEELNLDEIGNIMGIGAARVCQIKKEALTRLKKSWDNT